LGYRGRWAAGIAELCPDLTPNAGIQLVFGSSKLYLAEPCW
jgi:hypothetical protein